jgi:hypothetical protein
MKSKKTGIKIARCETIVAGNAIYRKISGRRTPPPKGKRAPRQNPTPDEMARLNEHNAIRCLSIKFDANFSPGDHHLMLTHEFAPTVEEAMRLLENFIRRLSRRYRKLGIPFRWITVTEYSRKRIHHHFIVTGGILPGEIAKIWGHGGVVDRTMHTKSFRKLAEYVIKETRKTFRDPDAALKRRYSCSRNVKMPPAKVEPVARADFEADPKPVKGYYVDRDTVYRGENPVTGKKYIEYTMISLAADPRIKKWNRGRTVKVPGEPMRGWYRGNMPKQLEMRC